MQWMPDLSLHWLNGWILLLLYLAVMFVQPLLYSNHRQVIERLMKHPRHTAGVRRIMRITIYLYCLMLFLMIFLPIQTEGGLWTGGLSIFAVSMILYAVSVHVFAMTPLDRPVTKGLYRLSRNPIHFFSWIACFGIGLMTGSWLIILLNGITGIGLHIGTLAEERYCLEKYGDSYREYMSRVPRYFLFF